MESLRVRLNCTTAVCNTLIAGGVMAEGDNPEGVLSFAHAPEELQEALEPGGELHDQVEQTWVFEPDEKEEEKSPE